MIPVGEQYLEIDELYVNSALRGSGIGGKLLARLTEIGRKSGVKYFNGYSATKDFHGILRFYRHHGFEPWYLEMFV